MRFSPILSSSWAGGTQRVQRLGLMSTGVLSCKYGSKGGRIRDLRLFARDYNKGSWNVNRIKQGVRAGGGDREGDERVD